MKHYVGWIVGLALAVGCSYKEYYTYNQIVPDGDAGADPVVGRGGASGGQAGSGAGGAGQAGSALTGAGGDPAAAGPDCTGCVRLSIVPGRTAEYQLEFAATRNLSRSLVLWRVRVRDYVGSVSIMGYVESGEHLDLGAGNGPGQDPNELAVARTFVTLDPAAGWQDVGIDLQQVEPFRAPSLDDAGGGAAGAGFDPGVAFDKSRVERVGLAISPFSQSGVFTPASLEIDAVSFSSQANLNFDFAADTGDFALVDAESAVVTHVAE